jgi:hypothetical protein
VYELHPSASSFLLAPMTSTNTQVQAHFSSSHDRLPCFFLSTFGWSVAADACQKKRHDRFHFYFNKSTEQEQQVMKMPVWFVSQGCGGSRRCSSDWSLEFLAGKF